MKTKRIAPAFFVALLAATMAVEGPAAAQEMPPRLLPRDQLVAHLLDVAKREWRDWGRTEIDATDGRSTVLTRGAVESDTAWVLAQPTCIPKAPMLRSRDCRPARPFDALDRVRRYWAEGLGPDSKPARDSAELERVARHAPWSAIFISFLMREVGLSPQAFPVDDRHSNYLRGIARRAGPSAQFAVLPARGIALEPGDLVCGPRNLSRDPGLLTLQRMGALPDLQRLTASHCDLAVKIDRRRRVAGVIGGNVADSVAMTRIPLTADGRAIDTVSRPVFVVVRPL